MAKRMKRKTLVGLLVVSSVLATAGILGVVDGKTGAVSKIFEEENRAEYRFSYTTAALTAELTDDSTLSQKVDLSGNPASPFKKAVYNLHLYGDEDAGILDEDGGTFYAMNCSKLEIKLTLKDDADFYVSMLQTSINYVDSEGNVIDSFDEGLNLKMRVGLHEFTTYDNQSSIYAMSQNAYSDDIVITITNDKAREKEDSIFEIPSFTFNPNENNSYPAN